MVVLIMLVFFLSRCRRACFVGLEYIHIYIYIYIYMLNLIPDHIPIIAEHPGL